MNLSLLDDIIQVTDRDCFVWTRRLARAEGIFTGGSGGGCVYAALQVAQTLGPEGLIVAFLPDTGMRYLSKIYNDDWMREKHYLEPAIPLQAGDLARSKAVRTLITVAADTSVYDALETMQREEVSQVPVMEDGAPVGALREDDALKLALGGRDLRQLKVREVMGPQLPRVPAATPLDQLVALMGSSGPAVFVELGDGRHDLVTKYDLVRAVARLSENSH